MANVKSKFSLDQVVSVKKSGKVGIVDALVFNRDGMFVDVLVGSSKRPWRYSEADLQTQAEAEKRAREKVSQKTKARA